MTRDAWCESDVNSKNRHGAKQLAERRAKRQARLTQIGQKVEVLVLQQRDWYVGTVVPNDMGHADREGTNLLAVKFSNGNVLQNVRQNELRQVPRTTAAYWSLIALTWILCTVAMCANLLATAHTLRVGSYGDLWLFADRSFDKLPNMTLYNVTYGEVAAADAHPEAWLGVLLGEDVEKFRNHSICGAMRSNTLCVFRDLQDHLLGNNIGAEMLQFPLTALCIGSLGMRRYPVSLAITSLLTYFGVTVSSELFHEIAFDWSRKFPNKGRQEIMQRAIRRCALVSIGWVAIGSVLFFVIFPFVSGLTRRNGKVRSVSRAFIIYFVGLVIWIVVYLRVLHFLTLLQDIMVTDSNLERLASNMMYLEASGQYLNNSLFWFIPTMVIVLYGLNRGLPWTIVVVFNSVLLIPQAVWKFVVAQPLPVFAPVSWQLASKYLPGEKFIVSTLFRRSIFVAFGLVLVQAVLSAIFRAAYTLRQITTLHVRTRKALSSWAALGTHSQNESQSKGPASTKNYQPLNRLSPSVEVIRPIATQFETNLDQPGARLRSNSVLCLASSLSLSTQMCRVLSATSLALAGYMARIVVMAGPGQRQVLRETLTEVCA